MALVTGLGVIVYLVHKAATEFEEEEKQINKLLYTLSLLPVIGLEWTAYGIAQSNGYSNGETAYLVALLFTSLAFTGLMLKTVEDVVRDVKEDDSKVDGLGP